MSQGVFRLKSDSPQSDGILDEVRAEALVYGILVEFEIQPDGTRSQQAAVGTSLPQQAEEILYEILTKHYLKFCEALNSERRARGLKSLGDPAKLAKQKRDFEKAYYGRLRHSEKGRMAVDRHILLSRHVAEDLEHTGNGSPACMIWVNARSNTEPVSTSSICTRTVSVIRTFPKNSSRQRRR